MRLTQGQQRLARQSNISRAWSIRVRVAALAVSAFACYPALSAATVADASPRPDPDLSPEQVVRIQLAALQRNDSEDGGIEVTYCFASPANIQQTGPLDRFVRMLKTAPYKPMLNHLNVDYGPMERRGDMARQRVTLVAASGATVTYVFILARQVGDPCDGCWMTEAVLVDREGFKGAKQHALDQSMPVLEPAAPRVPARVATL